MKYTEINDIIFSGKQNIAWNEVEQYLRKYDNMEIRIIETGDNVRINSVFADEYVNSEYTKKLRGGLAKAKANLAQVIPELVANATNRRWIENKDPKHNENAIKGWYRYDVHFAIRVYDGSERKKYLNYYAATAVIRINDKGCFLYDVINIKKEARTPTDH
ncbi:MAG: hypothetical protein K6B44_07855 [Lachnospiraceae bacterium]|nr:hypothetical protein [Lachnospiraceae bacterium]